MGTAMPEDFPIRCTLVGNVSRVRCDKPAVVGVQAERVCGCPGLDDTACARCSVQLPVGLEVPGICHRCGLPGVLTITAHRPLNEGDLP